MVVPAPWRQTHQVPQSLEMDHAWGTFHQYPEDSVVLCLKHYLTHRMVKHPARALLMTTAGYMSNSHEAKFSEPKLPPASGAEMFPHRLMKTSLALESRTQN